MKVSKTTLTLALTAVIGSAGLAQAAENPFAAQTLSKGYMVAAADDKGMEGKCGASMPGKAKEGKCGGEKAKEAKCGGEKAMPAKAKDGKCGEGKCGANKAKAKEKAPEAKCGGKQ